jgi:CRISPR-associated protein (TIGR03984 family)
MTTAAEALAGFHSASAGDQVIGYCYAPDAARWFVLDAAGAAWGPGGLADLSGVFELHATDGTRELRWLHEAGGSGRTAVLVDIPQPVALPPQRRLLAGEVTSMRGTPAGPWATVFTARYGQVDLPVDAAPGDRVQIESVEYVAEDTHGNLTVTDARWIGLRTTGANDD